MVITINQKEFKIKLAGTIKNPYFCGKDVCDILEQKDSKYALKTHVSPKYKKELSGFYPVNYDHNLGGGNPPPHTVVNYDHNLGKKEITFREGQVVYVSEPGLYSLIMGSKTPFALAFQELVYETILPSIREYGSYQVETRLSHVMEQLAIKEKSEEDLHIQLEQEKEARLKAERKAIRVNKFMRRIVVKEHKLEWIYIATNDQYSRERLFKIGSTTRLSSRIASYNTGRAKGVDTYYYVWAIKCYNSKDVDNHIQKLLSEFKYGKNQDVSKENRSEMYHGIKFTDLKDIVAFIVNNYDVSVDYINNFIKTRLNQSMEEEDDIPPPLNYKKLTYQIGEHIETIDLENEETESIREALEDILSSLKDQEERTISREALLTQLLSVTNASKQSLWNQIKEFTGWKNSKTEIDEGSFRYKIVY